MIKTSGYRVSPTEIEQVAYATGLVGDAVALGVDDERLGQRIVLVVSPANGRLEPNELLAGCAVSCLSTWFRVRSSCAPRCRGRPTTRSIATSSAKR